MKKNRIISSGNIILSIFLLGAISLSIFGIVYAAAPNPGHNFSSVGGGAVQGDIIYGSAADTFAALAKDTNATRYISNTGTTNNPAWAQVDLTNGVTGILPGANGGTANGFMAFSGPATSLKTFTLPNVTATILTTNSAVTAGQGGTGLQTLTANNVILGNGTGNVLFVAPSTAGNILQSDGTTWTTAAGGVINGRQTLTSGTTYTPTAGTTKTLIRIWGGGGGGGGCSAAAGCAGGGGGGGGYVEYYLTGVTGTYAYTIGTAGGGNSGAAGTAGGNSTFVNGGTTVTAFGGSGGAFTAGSAAIKFMLGGPGGVISTNGNVNGAGTPGINGQTSATVTLIMSGAGGSTSLGGGGNGRSSTGVGNAAIANTGSGGGGAAATTAVANAGGSGAVGIIIITEFK